MATEAVVAPKDHEGVGNALRRAYAPCPGDAPSDLWALLDKLN